MTVFDANDYAGVPTLNAALTIAMARRLIAEMPKILVKDKSIAVAADRLRARAEALRGERLKALELPGGIDARPFDSDEDNAWGMLFDRLSAASRLRLETYGEQASRASELVERLFPSRLAFLTFRFKEQWEESDRMLQLIVSEQWAGDLDELCGPEYLEEVQVAHAAYGEALGLTQAKPVAVPSAAIGDALLSLRSAVRFYIRRVVAFADEDDPSSVGLVELALAPLLEAQAEARNRRSVGAEEPEPADEGELPALPASA